MHAINQGCMLCQPINWSMAASLHDSVVVVISSYVQYAPTSKAASHDNHEKINSWLLFTFLYYMASAVPCVQRKKERLRSEGRFTKIFFRNLRREKYDFLLFLYQRNWKTRKLTSTTRIKTKKTQILIIRQTQNTIWHDQGMETVLFPRKRE